MASSVIIAQKRILWETLQLVLRHVNTSTSFEFQASVTELWILLQKARSH
ncbi:hypothetical protein BVRB_4g077500 [Beta vulgaris subsp. vulgaris]|nr:hypothetical protein BVRB_4g077500 [Beta vulgaris subsp. vulgaris]